MQCSFICSKEALQQRLNDKRQRSNQFPIEVKKPFENKLIIVKSYSVDRSNSLTAKSFFRKCSQSTYTRFKTKLRGSNATEQPISRQQMNKTAHFENSDLMDCVDQLRRFRKLEKEDIFCKISDIERKLSRQVRSIKNRENRKFLIEPRVNKIKQNTSDNNNSLNFNEIASVISVKPISHLEKSPLRIHERSKKPRIQSTFYQSKFVRLLQRGYRQNQSSIFSLSQSVKRKSCDKPVRKLQNEQFTGWKTEQDYDY